MSGLLDGVRILDFSHVVTGPFATGLLADYGADVIKIESATAVEPGRRLGPFAPGAPREPDGSALFAALNRNKRSVALNLKHPRGTEIALALADRCDVLVENFSVGTMGRLGLGHERVLARNPRLVYLSMSGLGATGPRAGWVSFNVVIQALSGLMLATGRPGDPPVGISNSWADFVAGLHGAALIAAALERRDRDGHGCWIDLSQYEANVLPIGHLVLESVERGYASPRPGNRSVFAAPQGCYPCAGDDAWCAVSVTDDTAWTALVALIGDAALAVPAYRTLAGRQAHADEIDAVIERWTRSRPASDVEAALRRAGVPAAAVRTNVEALAELPRFVPSHSTMTHPVVGEIPVPPNPLHPERAARRAHRAGPRLGEHTASVLAEILGMSAETVDQLAADGVLT
ncbi:MAG: CoA transferase [Armatimonadota bacterium]|nr:CoA transferase [Armatimonadota bacterium]